MGVGKPARSDRFAIMKAMVGSDRVGSWTRMSFSVIPFSPTVTTCSSAFCPSKRMPFLLSFPKSSGLPASMRRMASVFTALSVRNV